MVLWLAALSGIAVGRGAGPGVPLPGGTAEPTTAPPDLPPIGPTDEQLEVLEELGLEFNRDFWTNPVGRKHPFGFYMAVISGFGSLALSRRKQRKERKKA